MADKSESTTDDPGMGRPPKRKAETREQALGSVITDLRLEKGMTCQDVAEKVGIYDSHMNEIENGKQNPTLSTLQAIADWHKIPLSRMIARAERKYANRSRRPDTPRKRHAS